MKAKDHSRETDLGLSTTSMGMILNRFFIKKIVLFMFLISCFPLRAQTPTITLSPPSPINAKMPRTQLNPSMHGITTEWVSFTITTTAPPGTIPLVTLKLSGASNSYIGFNNGSGYTVTSQPPDIVTYRANGGNYQTGTWTNAKETLACPPNTPITVKIQFTKMGNWAGGLSQGSKPGHVSMGYNITAQFTHNGFPVTSKTPKGVGPKNEGYPYQWRSGGSYKSGIVSHAKTIKPPNPTPPTNKPPAGNSKPYISPNVVLGHNALHKLTGRIFYMVSKFVGVPFKKAASSNVIKINPATGLPTRSASAKFQTRIHPITGLPMGTRAATPKHRRRLLRTGTALP